MRSKLTLLMTLALIVIGTTQCKKKTAEEPPIEEPPPAAGINTVAEIITANGVPAYNNTVSATTASTLFLNGIIFEIPANAFVTSTGGTVGGIVTLTNKTILTKSQIIFSGAGANSSNSKLVSTKGCVKATASQNSQSLRLNTGGGFFLNFPDALPAPAPTKKYYAPKVTAVDSTAYWALGTDVADIAQVTYTSSSTVYHRAALDSLKWLNVGAQFDSVAAPKTALTVSVTASMFSKSNTMIFLSKNGSLTVGALFEISPGIFRISNMPQGMNANIIAISVINGQYYTAVMPLIIPAPGAPTINLTMNAVSQTQMVNQVNALP